jgi:nitrite reductase/ring-hydroxylating ferredoxin subunit
VTRYVVAEAGEIPDGGRKIVEVEGRSIGVFYVHGEYFALLNRCPHQAGPLCTGELWGALEATVPGEYRTSREGEILTCPWHGWEFDLRTGGSWCAPERLRVRTYGVVLEPGSALQEATDPAAPAPGLVRGPYVAETYPVAAEGRYVVVDLAGRASSMGTAGGPRHTPARLGCS